MSHGRLSVVDLHVRLIVRQAALDVAVGADEAVRTLLTLGRFGGRWCRCRHERLTDHARHRIGHHCEHFAGRERPTEEHHVVQRDVQGLGGQSAVAEHAGRVHGARHRHAERISLSECAVHVHT